MRKLVITAVTAALLFGTSAPSGSKEVAAAINAAPTVECTITKVKLSSSSALASGFCTRKGKRVVASQLDWRWTQVSADLTGLPCEAGRSAGKGATTPLKGVSGEALPGIRATLPGIVDVTFTLQLKGGAGKAKPKSVRKLTPESNIICGKPSSPETSVGTTLGACEWSDSKPPVFVVASGVNTMRAGTVVCPVGNGACRWAKDPPASQPPFIVFGHRLFCENGPEVAVEFFIYFARPEAKLSECSQKWGSMGSFVTPKKWGGGRISILAVLKTYESKNSSRELPKTDAARVYSPWFDLNREGDAPCAFGGP